MITSIDWEKSRIPQQIATLFGSILIQFLNTYEESANLDKSVLLEAGLVPPKRLLFPQIIDLLLTISNMSDIREINTSDIAKPKLKKLSITLDYVNLTKGINKRQIIGNDIPLHKIGNWSCPYCQLYFKDSNNYLRHLNSPEHNAKLGMSLDVARVTDEEVISRVDEWEEHWQNSKPIKPLFSKSGDSEILSSNIEKPQTETLGSISIIPENEIPKESGVNEEETEYEEEYYEEETEES